MVLLPYFSRYGRTDVRTDSHVTTKIFEIDGLPNFLRYGAPLAHLRRAGAPLQIRMMRINSSQINVTLRPLATKQSLASGPKENVADYWNDSRCIETTS